MLSFSNQALMIFIGSSFFLMYAELYIALNSSTYIDPKLIYDVNVNGNVFSRVAVRDKTMSQSRNIYSINMNLSA